MAYVTMSVDADVDDVIERLTTKELTAVISKHLPKTGISVERGLGEGDPQVERFVENAFLAAKAMPDCPKAILDLLWHVHGKAI